MGFSEELKQIRQRLGWSQDRMAREMTIDPEFPVTIYKINRWESGKRPPNPYELIGLRWKLGEIEKERL